MFRKIHRLLCISVSLIMILSLGALSFTWADDAADLNAAKKAAESKAAKTRAEIRVAKIKVDEMGDQLTALEKNIQQKEKDIAQLQSEIDQTQQTIQVVEQELAEALADIEQQNTDLDARLRAMYMNEEVGILDIVLSASNVVEFMSTLDMVQKIFESDVNLLESMEGKYTFIDAKRGELKSLELDLISKQTVQKSQKESIQADKNNLAKAKLEEEGNLKKLNKQLDEEVAAANKITEDIRKLQSSSTDFVGGKMAWPVPGHYNISSEFGNRVHPILKVKKMHTGMDIPAPTGTKVAAALGGTVIYSGWKNSYGNVVMIDHGGKIVSLYAHNNSLAVKAGQKVNQGDTIAYVGSTGSSTGPHCHFEVRKDGAYQNPRNWLTKQ